MPPAMPLGAWFPVIVLLVISTPASSPTNKPPAAMVDEPVLLLRSTLVSRTDAPSEEFGMPAFMPPALPADELLVILLLVTTKALPLAKAMAPPPLVVAEPVAVFNVIVLEVIFAELTALTAMLASLNLPPRNMPPPESDVRF